MTTEETFQKAFKLVNACRGIIESGCEFNEEDANWLYYQCREFYKLWKDNYEK